MNLARAFEYFLPLSVRLASRRGQERDMEGILPPNLCKKLSVLSPVKLDAYLQPRTMASNPYLAFRQVEI